MGRNGSLPSYHRRVSTLLGPLGSFRNFVSMIVLPNVCDYDREQKRLAEGLSKDSTRRELTRRLFNAVVALDSAVDHYYHDVKPGTSLQDFLKTLPPEIAQLRELSNAMKHCVRGTEKKGVFTVADGKAHAKDIAKTHIEGSVTIENGVPVVQLTFSSTLLEGADELLGSAFRYWVSHL